MAAIPMTSKPAVLPPGPPGLPVLGHLPQLNASPQAFLARLARTYGPVASYRTGRQNAVLFSHPAGIQQVLVGQAAHLSIQEYNHVMRPIMGRSLLTTEGEEHARLRRMEHAAFSTRAIMTYGDTVVAHTERLLAGWTPDSTVEMFHEMARGTQAIIADVISGVSDHKQAEILSRSFSVGFNLVKYRWLALAFLVMEQAMSGMVKKVFPQQREPGAVLEYLCRGPVGRIPGTPFHRMRSVRETAEGIRMPVIQQRRASGQARGDVLSSLLKARDGDVTFDDTAIADQLITLLIGGAGFSPLGLTYTLYALATHPDIDARLYAELKRVLGGRAPRVEDLENLPYLNQVWKEALRLYPPAWVISRFCKEDIEIEGYSLPAGTMVAVSPWATHRLPEFFERPAEFNPDRFSPTGKDNFPMYMYFPFGAGARRCIGDSFATLEAKLLLATLLQRFAPRLPSDQTALYTPRQFQHVRMTLRLRAA